MQEQAKTPKNHLPASAAAQPERSASKLLMFFFQSHAFFNKNVFRYFALSTFILDLAGLLKICGESVNRGRQSAC